MSLWCCLDMMIHERVYEGGGGLAFDTVAAASMVHTWICGFLDAASNFSDTARHRQTMRIEVQKDT